MRIHQSLMDSNDRIGAVRYQNYGIWSNYVKVWESRAIDVVHKMLTGAFNAMVFYV